ncbi:MAG: endopeptidase La [Chthonomonadaceae bacterium]|nr:endopeptidase La [Chthonomonadaceae bacterium]
MSRRPSRQESEPCLTAPVLPTRNTVHFPGVIQTLLIGRDMSVKALQEALKFDREALVIGQRDETIDNPRAAELYSLGTLSEVLHVLPLPDGTMRVVLRGLSRAKIQDLTYKKGYFTAKYDLIFNQEVESLEMEALAREAVESFKHAAAVGMTAPPEVAEGFVGSEEPGYVADLLSHHLPISAAIKQSLLEEASTAARLEMLIGVLSRERQILELQSSLRAKVEKEVGQSQREFFLREQLKAIQAELGIEEPVSDEAAEFLTKFKACGMPVEAEERALAELKRLERSPSNSPEGMVIRTYLDWLVSLPWSVQNPGKVDIHKAARILDRDHYGLAKVKERILDFLAVSQLAPLLSGPILCFVGPPGVGKTSIGRSIAESMGRAFHRVSLGGVRDEAEIRGHRRTYIGSMPGRLIQGIRSCGSQNPVFILDEIDKMGLDYRGDPASALLEALDPEQNKAYSDHYIEIPYNLSAVTFIATANVIDNVPQALRDRLEVIQFPSYTEDEKLFIMSKYIVPKKMQEHGLKKSQIVLPKSTLTTVVQNYTREAGVRNAEREIATLCRKVARRVVEGDSVPIKIDTGEVAKMLGKPRFRFGVKEKKNEIGAATGLVVSEFGGDIVMIEVSLTPPFGEQPQVRLTGSLGDVMKESALAAVTYLRANRAAFGQEEFRYDLHVHVPEGGVPKDGPSAGVTILTALVSAYSGRPVRNDVAMTGEITLRGKVLAVGGVREKVLAAHRAGFKHIILPHDNRRDIEDLPLAISRDVTFHTVSTADEVLAVALVD